MEWVLQVVDEIDDAIGIVRHGWFGICARFDVPVGAVLAAAAATAGSALRTGGSTGPAHGVNDP